MLVNINLSLFYAFKDIFSEEGLFIGFIRISKSQKRLKNPCCKDNHSHALL